MTEASVKSKVLKAVEELPADVSYEDVMERLYLLYKIEKGMQEHGSGQGVPHEVAKKNMRRWYE